MPKVLEATCTAGIVSVGELPITDAVILSEGVAASTGFLIIQGSDSYYVAKTSPDLKTTLEKISSCLDSLISALGLLDAKPIGTLPPAVAVTTDIAELTALQVELDALTEALK